MAKRTDEYPYKDIVLTSHWNYSDTLKKSFFKITYPSKGTKLTKQQLLSILTRDERKKKKTSQALLSEKREKKEAKRPCPVRTIYKHVVEIGCMERSTRTRAVH